MIESNIKHFKLTNDEEIICDVVEYPNEQDASMIVRSALRIVLMEDFQKGVRFYAFRPWMSFSENPQELQILNADHIIAQSTPSVELLKHYAKTLLAIQDQKERMNLNLDEVAAKVEALDEDEFEMYIDNLRHQHNGDDSDFGNIIKFPDKSKLH